MQKILFTALAVFSIAMSSASVTVGAATVVDAPKTATAKSVEFVEIANVPLSPTDSTLVEIRYSTSLVYKGVGADKCYQYEVDGVLRSTAYYL